MSIPRLLLTLLFLPLAASVAPGEGSPLDAENLAAWCIVPFDAKKRGPTERAAMLDELGIRRCAYDWRDEHVATFEAEILAYQKHNIEFFAFWGSHPEAFALFRKYKLQPQIWQMIGGQTGATDDEMVESAAKAMEGLAKETDELGCKLALYNHGGWAGEPKNMVAVCERLRAMGYPHVGIVYNFHHGHGHIDDWEALFAAMKPYLHCLNLNGMVAKGDEKGKKILALGHGDRELGMLRVVLESGYEGPIGIIDHRPETDSAETLKENLVGLEWLRKELAEPGSGGPQPKPEPEAQARGQLVPGKFGLALNAADGGLLLEGKDAWRTAPITVEAWAKLRDAAGFNVIVASDPKSSSAHWELYSYAGKGDFAVFLPGRGGEVRSGTPICDDAWHHLAMVLEKERVRLFVDGKMVAEKPLPGTQGAVVPGELGIGRTVEPGIGCNGLVDDVRISAGVREITGAPTAAHPRDATTLELFDFDSLPETSAVELPERGPLDPAAHPLHALPVNRDRLYDFYAKQARDWKANPRPLLPPFPGLDGTTANHFGNQSEDTWRSERWNEMDVGPVQGGVFRSGRLTVARAVCVDLGDLAACFDPDRLAWPVTWRGGFLRFGSARFGFLDGIAPAGDAMPGPEPASKSTEPFRYHGYYRHGRQVVFAYERGGIEWLEMAEVSGGKLTVRRETADAGKLAALTRGGPSQWPQTFTTRGTRGEGAHFAIDTIPLPPETPWRSLFHFGDHDFFPNGDAALATFEGEVWIVSGLDEALESVTWRRFATGLHQALGLRVVEGKVCVLGRDQITRLHDLNGDGEADFYECHYRGYDSPAGGHDYVTGLERDQTGRFYFASGKQGVMRADPATSVLEILATGVRNPNGVAVGPDGQVAVAVQEGDWTPASMLYAFDPRPGEAPHFGFGGPRPGPRGHEPPLAYLPRAIDHSSGGQCYVEGDRWGLPAGTLLHFSWGNGSVFAVLKESLGNVSQGCVIPLPGDFRSGAHRGRFHPRDGQLYVTGMTGWITYTPDEGSFQRMRYTGPSPVLPVATEARDNGIVLRFDEPLPSGAARDAQRFFAQQWNYRYSSAYGSEEYSVLHPDKPGHDALAVTSAHLLDGGRALFLEIPQLQPANVLHLHCAIPELLARDFYLTVHRLGPAFTDFPGYAPVPKSAPTASAGTPDATIAAARPVPWETGEPGRALTITAAAGLQFAEKELHARPGERLSLTFENPDAMPHNWVLIQPGSTDRVGQLANALITASDGAARHYVPDSPDILCHTRILDPQSTSTIHFTAPDKPGRYPYLCTFPGHWMLMRGELILE